MRLNGLLSKIVYSDKVIDLLVFKRGLNLIESFMSVYILIAQNHCRLVASYGVVVT